jgi:hypothetical protein
MAGAREAKVRPKRRGNLRAVGAMVMIGSLNIALFLGNSATSGAGVESPTQVSASVYAAAMNSGSFHYVDLQRIGFGGPIGSQIEIGDVALTKGIQFVSGTLGDSETIVIGSAAYLKANAPALEVDLLWTKSMATKYANRWISFTPKDWPYDAVIEFVVTRTFWDDPERAPVESLPQKPTSIGGRSTLDGESVETVASSIDDIVKSTNSSFIGDSRVYFDSNSPHLPFIVTDSTSGTEAGSPQSQQDVATFTKWGETVKVTVPTGAVAFSSLPKL